MEKEKQPYTIQLETEKEAFIREKIETIKKRTGMSKKRIATEFLLFGIENKKNLVA